MADGYGFGRTVRDEDFEEEDVWSAMKERKDKSPKGRRAKDCLSSTNRRLPSASRLIPKFNASSEAGGRVFQQSAPVNIADWSMIYRKNSSTESHSQTCMQHRADGIGINEGYDHETDNGSINDDGDYDDDDKVPPHEWIAKKLARSQISSFSVCEGAGRTLKGRDLSKVRNAVLTRTGFLE